MKKMYDGRYLIFNGGSNQDANIKHEVPKELLNVCDEWRELSAKTGDIGCCVMGAGMVFEYEGNQYEMFPQSPYQGEGSWTKHKDLIVQKLKDIGATNVRYNWGVID